MHTYLPYVDGLRALAVLSVLVYHLNPAWLPGGFSGVDVFFVISGFIVSVSVSRVNHFGQVGPLGLARFMAYFYARRIQRIFPALLVCLLATTLATAVLVPAAWLSDGIQRTGLFAFFGLSNFILAQTGKDYFSPSAEFNPFTHTWSLGVEEQFYLVFPLLFFLWGLQGGRKRWSPLLFGALLMVSVAYSAWLGSADKTAAFYMLASRFWELAAGVLLFQWMALRGNFAGAVDRPVSIRRVGAAWLSLGLVTYGLVASKASYYAFPGALPTVLGTLGLLWFLHGMGAGQWLVRLLSAGPVLWVGRISYSLYLWHWPVFVLFRWTVGMDSTSSRAAAVAIAFVLAVLSYRLVETPVRQWRGLRAMPRGGVVAAGLLCVGAAAGLSVVVTAAQPRLSVSTVTQQAHDWYPEGRDSSPALPGCRVQPGNTQLPHGYYLSYAREGCAPEPAPVKAPRIFAIGDSHAMAYIAMFKGYVLQTGGPVFIYGNAGCPFMSLRPQLEAAPACKLSSAAAVADMMQRLKLGDVVFLPSLRMPRFSDQWALFPEDQVRHSMFSEEAVRGRIDAEQAAAVLLADLRKTGARIVLEAPKPVFRAPPYRCAEAYNQSNAICRPGTTMDRLLLEEYRAPVLAAFERLTARDPGVTVWDPFLALCPPGRERCEAQRDGRPLFFDADHLSGYGNAFLLPYFLAAVRPG